MLLQGSRHIFACHHITHHILSHIHCCLGTALTQSGEERHEKAFEGTQHTAATLTPRACKHRHGSTTGLYIGRLRIELCCRIHDVLVRGLSNFA